MSVPSPRDATAAASPPRGAPVAGPSPRDATAAAQPAANAVVARALAEALVPADAVPRHVVVSPGSRSTPLVLACAAQPRLTVHVVLDERAAAFLALGIGRRSGCAAVLICTSGTAGLHYAPAVAEAAAAAVPLLVLTADRPPELHGCGAPQTMLQQPLFTAPLRLATALATPTAADAPVHAAAAAATVAQALDAAEALPGGPAHINVPLREPLYAAADAATAARTLDAFAAPSHAPVGMPGRAAAVVRAAPQLAASTVAALALQLRGIRRGAIICGPRPAAVDAFAAAVGRLAAALGWPLLAEATSQARVHSVEMPTGIVRPWAFESWLRVPELAAAARPDAVLRFGAWPTGRGLGALAAAAPAAAHWHVEPAGRRLDPAHTGATILACDEVALCDALTGALAAEPLSPHASAVTAASLSHYAAALATLDAAAAAALGAACAAAVPFSGSVARAVTDALPAGAALHVGNSMAVRDVDGFVAQLPAGVAVLHQRGVSGIDGAVAGALGAALAAPGPVVGLLGDLSLWHDIGALALAPLLGTRTLTLVAVDNGGGGIFDFLPVATDPAYIELFRTPQPGALVAAARGLGVAAESFADLPALRAWLARPQPGLRLAVVPVAPSPAAHRAAWQAAAQACADLELDPASFARKEST